MYTLDLYIVINGFYNLRQCTPVAGREYVCIKFPIRNLCVIRFKLSLIFNLFIFL